MPIAEYLDGFDPSADPTTGFSLDHLRKSVPVDTNEWINQRRDELRQERQNGN